MFIRRNTGTSYYQLIILLYFVGDDLRYLVRMGVLLVRKDSRDYLKSNHYPTSKDVYHQQEKLKLTEEQLNGVAIVLMKSVIIKLQIRFSNRATKCKES